MWGDKKLISGGRPSTSRPPALKIIVIKASRFMFNFCFFFKGNDHEVEFHEIEIQLFHEIEFLIMRSKFYLFMRSNLSNNIDQEVDTLIMRSKPKQSLFLISISWLFLWLTNRSWDQNSKRSIIRKFRSHDQFVSHKNNHEIECFYAQMANN